MTIADYVGKAIQLFAQLGDDYSEWLVIEFMNGLQDTELWDAIDSQAEGPLTFPDILRFYAGTLVQKLRNEEVVLREMIKCNQQIDFGTYTLAAIPKFKEQPRTTAEIFAEVIETIRQEVAMEKVEILAEIVVI